MKILKGDIKLIAYNSDFTMQNRVQMFDQNNLFHDLFESEWIVQNLQN